MARAMTPSGIRGKIVGRKIAEVRLCTQEEKDDSGFDEDFEVIVLDNGTKLWAQCDGEGNGAGVMVGEFPSMTEDTPFGFYLRDSIN